MNLYTRIVLVSTAVFLLGWLLLLAFDGRTVFSWFGWVRCADCRQWTRLWVHTLTTHGPAPKYEPHTRFFRPRCPQCTPGFLRQLNAQHGDP